MYFSGLCFSFIKMSTLYNNQGFPPMYVVLHLTWTNISIVTDVCILNTIFTSVLLSVVFLFILEDKGEGIFQHTKALSSVLALELNHVSWILNSTPKS